MKMIKQIVFFGSLALFGAGCVIPGVTESETQATAETSPVPKTAVCAQTPQVFFFNRLAFSDAELSSIRTNVVDRMKTYYRSLPGHELVSVSVRRTATGIVVDAVIDQPESNDPIHEGFVLDRLKDGSYPVYEPVDAGTGYEG